MPITARTHRTRPLPAIPALLLLSLLLNTGCSSHAPAPESDKAPPTPSLTALQLSAALEAAGHPQVEVTEQFLRSLAIPGLDIRLLDAAMDADALSAQLPALLDTQIIPGHLRAVQLQDAAQNSLAILWRTYADAWEPVPSAPTQWLRQQLEAIDATTPAGEQVYLHLLRGCIALHHNHPILARHHLLIAGQLADASADLPLWLDLHTQRCLLRLSRVQDDEDLFQTTLPRFAKLVGTSPITAAEMQPILRILPTAIEVQGDRRRTGFALLEFTVNAAGRPVNIEIIDSNLAQAYRREAVRVMALFAYEPRIEDGVPVDTPGVRYNFEFRAGR